MTSSLCVPTWPSYKDANHWDLEPTLLQYDLVLTNYICNDPISK